MVQIKAWQSLQKLQKSPKIKKIAERRQVKTLGHSNTKESYAERLKRKNEARNTALRLNPDISNLHKAMLSWTLNILVQSPW